MGTFWLYLLFLQTNYFIFFSKFTKIICTIFLCNKKYRSPCSLKRKGPSHLLRFPLIENVPTYSRKKGRMFLHFQRFQHFRSAVFSFFATNFHLFFPNHAFPNAHFFFACELSGLYFVSCYYAQYRMLSAILRNHTKFYFSIFCTCEKKQRLYSYR